MDEKTMLEIAAKIKNKTATKEEVTAFTKEFTKLLEEIKEDLKTE
ncbi:MAG: hypothetical protein WCW54_02430 [Candidatus Paceibacterota bacterium]